MLSINHKISSSTIVYLFGVASTIYLGRFLVELVWPILFFALPPANNHRSDDSGYFHFRAIPVVSLKLAYIIIAFSFFSFLVYQYHGWIDKFLDLYRPLISNYANQTLRLLLIPIFLYFAYRLQGAKNMHAYLEGFGFGIFLSILFGLSRMFLGFSTRLDGFSGEPRHLSALITVYVISSCLLIKNDRPLKSIFLLFLIFSLPLTFSYTGSAAFVGFFIGVIITRFIERTLKGRLPMGLLFFLLFASLATTLTYFLVIKDGRSFHSMNDVPFIEFIEYAWGKDALPLKYLLHYPISFLSGFGPGGLNMIYMDTNLALANDIQSSIIIFQPFTEGSNINKFMAPSSSLLYLITGVGIFPILFTIYSFSFIYPRVKSTQYITRFSLLTGLFITSLFLGYNSLLPLLFVLVISGKIFFPDPIKQLTLNLKPALTILLTLKLYF